MCLRTARLCAARPERARIWSSLNDTAMYPRKRFSTDQ